MNNNSKFQVRIAKFLSKASSFPILIALIAVLVLVLLVPVSGERSGIAKFVSDLFDSNTLRDVAYKGASGDNIGWGSAIAYAFGVILILGILVPVITNRMRTLGDRYLNGTLDRYRWKDHALFIGYDELMVGTLKKACEKYKSVVVAVPGGVLQVREQLSNCLLKDLKKIEIVQCNQNDEVDLEKKAGIMEASRIFIIGQPDVSSHDAKNLRTLAIVANKWKGQEMKKKKLDGNKVPHIMVYLRNQSTFSLLQRQGFFAENIWGIIGVSFSTKEENDEAQDFVNRHCEYFNFYCDKALRMLSTSPDEGGMSLVWHSPEKNLSLSEMENKQVHLVVLGMTQMGTALVRELLRLAHPSGKGTKMLITMVDENACEEMHYFVGCTKELFKLCHYSYYDYNVGLDKMGGNVIDDDFLDVEFEFIRCDVAHPRLTDKLLEWSSDKKQLLTLVVCTNNSPKNMAVAMYLPPEMYCGENAVPTWIYQEGDDSVRQLLNRTKYPNMHPFSFADHEVASTVNSPLYDWDRSVIKYYEEHYRTKKVTEQWENKPQDHRWSSLYSIKSIGIKLRAVGVRDVTQGVEESQKLLIDYYEHNRWVVERLSMGARPTNAVQHELVVQELEREINKHPNWKPQDDSPAERDRSEKVCSEIEKNRTEFRRLKKGEGEGTKGIVVHDDIRRFDDLDDYTRYKDRKTLDDYIESIKKTPRL